MLIIAHELEGEKMENIKEFFYALKWTAFCLLLWLGACDALTTEIGGPPGFPGWVYTIVGGFFIAGIVVSFFFQSGKPDWLKNHDRIFRSDRVIRNF